MSSSGTTVATQDPVTLRRKAAVAVRTLRNWPMLVVDKLGLCEEVTYRTRDGLTVRCRSRTPDVNELVVVASGSEYPFPELSRSAIVLDVGANIGSFALSLLARHRGKDLRLVAFEPYPPNVSLLQRNLVNNGFGSMVVEPVAMAGRNGREMLDTSGAEDAVKLDPTGDMPVETVSLSSYCARVGIGSIDLLKLDVEGAEYEIFRADRNFILRSVKAFMLEFHEGFVSDPLDFFFTHFRPQFAVTLCRKRSSGGILYMTNTNFGADSALP